jgi:hypothetical protein
VDNKSIFEYRNQKNVIMVDFANKFIGGGVVGTGNVQ